MTCHEPGVYLDLASYAPGIHWDLLILSISSQPMIGRFPAGCESSRKTHDPESSSIVFVPLRVTWFEAPPSTTSHDVALARVTIPTCELSVTCPVPGLSYDPPRMRKTSPGLGLDLPASVQPKLRCPPGSSLKPPGQLQMTLDVFGPMTLHPAACKTLRIKRKQVVPPLAGFVPPFAQGHL